ncbi:MAG: hypothetical protein GY859_28710, partial [Desulfobacterales bacterium]|nr:hypothetical protein [Desulfobacterales bacterium]
MAYKLVIESPNPSESYLMAEIRDMAGSPLPEAAVSIQGHPEYGTVFTDADGRFTIPAEGGGLLIVVYKKEGRVTLHRKIQAPWGDIVNAPEVRMMEEDPAAT